MSWFWRLVCRWRGRHAPIAWNPDALGGWEPGDTIGVPVAGLVEYRYPPDLSPSIFDQMPDDLKLKYLTMQCHPLIVLHTRYCVTCEEVLD